MSDFSRPFVAFFVGTFLLAGGVSAQPMSCHEARGTTKNPPPEYPRAARLQGETGRVLLRVYVSAEGYPERIELRESSGSERLDRGAVKSVGEWCFHPARKEGKAVGAWVLVPVLYQLE